MAADVAEGARAREVDSPPLAPAFEDELVEEASLRGQLDEIGGLFGEGLALGPFEEEVVGLDGLRAASASRGVAGGVEDGEEGACLGAKDGNGLCAGLGGLLTGALAAGWGGTLHGIMNTVLPALIQSPFRTMASSARWPLWRVTPALSSCSRAPS
ncbi:MAG: hypothetical protein R3F14_40445 [Polyangiaceae bacterium]